MAVLPPDDTVAAVVATTNFTPGERKPASQNWYSGVHIWEDDHQHTFVVNGIVKELSGSVFHGQAVPQGEVVDGEQVVFVRWSQEPPARNTFSLVWHFNQTLYRTKLSATAPRSFNTAVIVLNIGSNIIIIMNISNTVLARI